MRSKLSAAVVCAVLGVAGTAAAQDGQPSGTKAGKLGVEVAASPFVAGLGGQFRITDDIALEAILGVEHTSFDDPNMEGETQFGLSVRGIYSLVDLGPRVDLGAFGGFGLQTNSGADTLIGLEAGLKLYYALVPFMLLHVDVGVAIGINTSAQDAMGMGINTTILDIGRGDLFGGGGLLFVL